MKKKSKILIVFSIIMSTPTPDYNENFYGAVNFNLDNKKENFILPKYYVGEPTYNFNKSKILFCSGSSLFEYNIKTKDVNLLIFNSKILPSYPKYVPNSDNISYSIGDTIMIYNLITNEEKSIIEGIGDYSWSNDGRILLFTKKIDGKKKICSYNIEIKKNQVLFEGSNPIYSPNNQYIAYIDNKENKRKIIVRDINTNMKKEYIYGSIRSMCFSPDSDKLAIIQESKKYSKNFELMIWEFNLNKKWIYMDLIHHDVGFDWK